MQDSEQQEFILLTNRGLNKAKESVRQEKRTQRRDELAKGEGKQPGYKGNE